MVACQTGNDKIQVMSFNIRYDNPSDGINSWSNRKELVASFVSENAPDVIGFQEVLVHQLEYLDQNLIDYEYVGVGREDGLKAGEFVPIFYKKDKYELLATSQFWLSDSPAVAGSKSWGAQLPRIVTWAQLQDKNSGYIFYVFNAHLSHVSEYARNESSVLILKKIASLAGDLPVILTGDFNAQKDEKMYKTLTGHWKGHYPLWDANAVIHDQDVDSLPTYNGFNLNTEPIRIDYIFANGYFDVLDFNTYPVRRDSLFISDHYPIQAELQFEPIRKKSRLTEKKLAQTLSPPSFLIHQFVFEDNLIIPLKAKGTDVSIYYTLDGKVPDSASICYDKPIILNETSTITARSYSNQMHPSMAISRTFIKKRLHGLKIMDVTPMPNDQYAQDGFTNLLDFHAGSDDLSDGSWSGFNGADVTIICELSAVKSVEQVHVSVLNNPGRWIIVPDEVKVAISDNGYDYIEYGGISVTPSYDTSKRESLLLTVNGKKSGRFIKITLYNAGVLPQEHPGAGNPSWIFLDEIVVN